MTKVKGFTFFELCIVMMIIASLALISLPSFRWILDNARVKIEQEKVLRMIRLAQQSAVTKKLQVFICKSKNGQLCDGDFADGEIVATTLNADGSQSHVIYVEDHRQGILYWQSYPRYRHSIMFMPSGLLASDNSTLWYCNLKESAPSFAIFLSKGGRTRIILPDAQGSIFDSKKHVLKCEARD